MPNPASPTSKLVPDRGPWNRRLLLTCRNYKGFREEIEFEVGAITLALGPNSGGKSSLLRLLASFCAFLGQPLDSTSTLPLKGAGWDLGNALDLIPVGEAPETCRLEIGLRLKPELAGAPYSPATECGTDDSDQVTRRLNDRNPFELGIVRDSRTALLRSATLLDSNVEGGSRAEFVDAFRRARAATDASDAFAAHSIQAQFIRGVHELGVGLRYHFRLSEDLQSLIPCRITVEDGVGRPLLVSLDASEIPVVLKHAEDSSSSDSHCVSELALLLSTMIPEFDVLDGGPYCLSLGGRMRAPSRESFIEYDSEQMNQLRSLFGRLGATLLPSSSSGRSFSIRVTRADCASENYESLSAACESIADRLEELPRLTELLGRQRRLAQGALDDPEGIVPDGNRKFANLSLSWSLLCTLSPRSGRGEESLGRTARVSSFQEAAILADKLGLGRLSTVFRCVTTEEYGSDGVDSIPFIVQDVYANESDGNHADTLDAMCTSEAHRLGQVLSALTEELRTNRQQRSEGNRRLHFCERVWSEVSAAYRRIGLVFEEMDERAEAFLRDVATMLRASDSEALSCWVARWLLDLNQWMPELGDNDIIPGIRSLHVVPDIDRLAVGLALLRRSRRPTICGSEGSRSWLFDLARKWSSRLRRVGSYIHGGDLGAVSTSWGAWSSASLLATASHIRRTGHSASKLSLQPETRRSSALASAHGVGALQQLVLRLAGDLRSLSYCAPLRLSPPRSGAEVLDPFWLYGLSIRRWERSRADPGHLHRGFQQTKSGADIVSIARAWSTHLRYLQISDPRLYRRYVNDGSERLRLLDDWCHTLELGLVPDWDQSFFVAPNGHLLFTPWLKQDPKAGAGNAPLLQDGKGVSLHDAGTGVSQVLPVLFALLTPYFSSEHLTSRSGSIAVIEQPELHLHPRLQARLARVMLDAVSGKAFERRSVVAETHSEHLVMRLQHEVRMGRIKPADVCVHWVNIRMKDENGIPMPPVWRIPLDEKGRFTVPWPEGFFDDSYEECVREPSSEENGL